MPHKDLCKSAKDVKIEKKMIFQNEKQIDAKIQGPHRHTFHIGIYRCIYTLS